ncbi:WRAP73 [Symbiodinium microadriaticum]|nr:WRAP73 [Symbiodinium microadriaticum]
MDESLTSDLDSDSETECRALVGETGRRSDHGCCCGLCCKVCILLSLCALVAGAVFHEALVARLASIGIAAAHIQFESVDVGTIRNSQTLSPRILASVSNPSPVNADVRMSRLVLKVPIFPSGTLARVGTVTMPSLRVQAFQDLQINISAHVHIEDLDVFGLAGKHAVREPNSSWVVEGKLQVRCELLFFAAYFSDIPFERQVALKGMASFSQDVNPVTMEAITSAYGYPDHLDTTVAINIYNPSYISAHLDTPTHFNITQRGRPFGTAVVQEVTLKPGRNTVSVRFLLHDDSSNREAVREFILGYIRADMQMVTMHGTERSCSDPLLAVVLDGLDLRFHFKPPAARFIHHITANLGLIGLQVTAEVANPLPQKIELGGTDLSVRENTVEGEQIFRLKGDQDSGLGGQVLRPSEISALKLSLSTLDADLKDPLLIARLIEDAVDGAVVVGVSGPLSLTIAPNFTLTLNYIANNVTASITCLLVCGSSHSLLNPENWHFPSNAGSPSAFAPSGGRTTGSDNGSQGDFCEVANWSRELGGATANLKTQDFRSSPQAGVAQRWADGDMDVTRLNWLRLNSEFVQAAMSRSAALCFDDNLVSTRELRFASTEDVSALRTHLCCLSARLLFLLAHGLLVVSIAASLATIEAGQANWWLIFLPVWIGNTFCLLLLTFSWCASCPYIKRCLAERTPRLNNHPSILTEILPEIVLTLPGLTFVVLAICAEHSFCAYLMSVQQGQPQSITSCAVLFSMLALLAVCQGALFRDNSVLWLSLGFGLLFSTIAFAACKGDCPAPGKAVVVMPFWLSVLCLLLASVRRMRRYAHVLQQDELILLRIEAGLLALLALCLLSVLAKAWQAKLGQAEVDGCFTGAILCMLAFPRGQLCVWEAKRGQLVDRTFWQHADTPPLASLEV